MSLRRRPPTWADLFVYIVAVPPRGVLLGVNLYFHGNVKLNLTKIALSAKWCTAIFHVCVLNIWARILSVWLTFCTVKAYRCQVVYFLGPSACNQFRSVLGDAIQLAA